MKGLALTTNSQENELIVTIDPLIFGTSLNKEAFLAFIQTSEFSHFDISHDKLLQLSDEVTMAADQSSMSPITQCVGQIKPAKIKVTVSDDEMQASVTLISPISGAVPALKTVIEELHSLGIIRGISKKRIRHLIQITADGKPGSEHTEIIAKGLPTKQGKDSYIQPLVQNALDRILAPTDVGNNKVNMRDLGDIISVCECQPVARRRRPSLGRVGFTLSNKKLTPLEGILKDIKLGPNTAISATDENLIISTIAGQPKFENGLMSVDHTYTSKGVNVGSGNINFNGAVIVNGDVTENMQVIAQGDITINGFVESAIIRCDGDIIITQGASGKMNDEDCQLIAKGNIFLQHGQGLDLIAGKNLLVSKQLAYSRVKCRGSVTVGNPDNPMGNLFASTINCFNTVKAGSVGAVSGSLLTIDFSEGYNLIVDRIDALADLFRTLSSKNADHEIKVATLNSKHIPKGLKIKLAELSDELESERVLLNWIRLAQKELIQKKADYEVKARVIANKELFPGVMVKLNKKMWKGEKECQRCRIILEDGNWIYAPMV